MRLGASLLVATSFAMVLAYSLLAFSLLFTADGALESPAITIIESGSSVENIGDQLEADGAVSSSLLFQIAARVYGKAATLKAGEYKIPRHASVVDILRILDEGKSIVHDITIPEGLTTYQILELIETHPSLSGDITLSPDEGSLLPETWHFTRGESRNSLIRRMQSAKQKLIDQIWQQRQPNLPLTSPEEMVILASIIEKETAVPEERRRVSGVFINRLRRGMRLQTDPTVIYQLSEGRGILGRPLLRKDLATAGSYNTYEIDGLPPAPICHPGRESLKAAVNPEDHDYLYFVADGTGGHAFAKTLREHNRNVQTWRRLNRK